jgi:hypothetical protein
MNIVIFKEIFFTNLIIFLFLIHCAILGFELNSHLNLWEDQEKSKDNLYIKWFFALSSGLITNIAVLFFLGIAGFLNRYAVLGGELLLLLFAAFDLLSSPTFRNRIKKIHFGSDVILELLAILTLFLIVVLSAIKTPGGAWDDTMYHLPLARFYVEHHAIVLYEYIRFPLFPQNIELLLSLGLMMGRDVLAQGMATVPLFIISIGLIGASMSLLDSKIAGFLAVLALFSLRVVHWSMGSALIDNGLALFCWGAILALALWVGTDHQSKGWIFIAGMLAGGAAGSKYLGLVLVFLLGFYLLAVRRDWRASLLYGIIVFVFGSWWYLRSFVISGDPFHPAGGNIFGYFLWNAQDLLGQKAEQATYGVVRNLKNFLIIWPALAKAGVSLWALSFLSFIYFKKEEKSIRLFQIIFVSYYTFWFFMAQTDRYLAPIFGVGSFLSMYFLYRVFRNRFTQALVTRNAWLCNVSILGALCIAVLLPNCVSSYQAASYHVSHWDEALQSRPGYTLLQKANRLIPTFGSNLIQIGFENGIYFFNGIAIGDWFGPGRYGSMKLNSLAKMMTLMEKFNSRMLVINTKRFPIDVAAYQKYFDIQQESRDGLLLTRKLSRIMPRKKIENKIYDYALSSEKVMAAELTQARIIRLNICGSQKRRLNR